MEPLIETYSRIENPINNAKSIFFNAIGQRFNAFLQALSEDQLDDENFESNLAYLLTFESLHTSNSTLNSNCFTCLYEARLFITKKCEKISKELSEFIELLEEEEILNETLIEKVKLVDAHLKEINAKSTYVQTWKLVREKLDFSRNKFKKSLVEISNLIDFEIQNLINCELIQKASNKLKVIRTLRTLDEYMNVEESLLFKSQFLKYNSALVTCIQKIYKRIVNLISNCEFEQAKFEILKLSGTFQHQSYYLNSISNELSKKLYRTFRVENLKREYIIFYEKINLKFIITAQNDIEKCIQLISNLSEYLSEADIKYLTDFLVEGKAILEKFFDEYLSQMKKLVRQKDFINAFNIANQILKQRVPLDGLVNSSIFDRVNEFKKKFGHHLLEFVNEYGKKELTDYLIHSPLNFYNQLMSLKNIDDLIDLIDVAKSKLREIVISKFECELKNAKLINSLNIYSNEHIKKCVRYSSEYSLPKEYKKTVDKMIKKCRNEIEFDLKRKELLENVREIITIENALLIFVFVFDFIFIYKLLSFRLF